MQKYLFTFRLVKVCLIFLCIQCLFSGQSRAQIITTIAGTGVPGYSGDSSGALSAKLNLPYDLVFDTSGNLYIADDSNECIRKITPLGIIYTIAGNFGYSTVVKGYAGDGGAARYAAFRTPIDVANNGDGNLYICDYSNYCVRKINAAGIMSTFAGSSPGFSGDGGLAIDAQFAYPLDVAVDDTGNVYIADQYNNRIRKVNTSGIISTFAGSGSAGSFSGDGGAATAATLYGPQGVEVDNKGNVYIADYSNNRIRKVNAAGIISTLAGNGTAGYSGDGGAATNAKLNQPHNIGIDNAGNVYFSEEGNNVIRKVDTAGIITTFAGTGTGGYSGDGGPASLAKLDGPGGITFDDCGNMYFCDALNNRIRMIGLGEAGGGAGTISGGTAVCVGSTLTLTDTVSGGVWVSSDTTIAKITTGGVVIPVDSGTVTISFIVDRACGTVVTTHSVIVNASTPYTSITHSGSATFCVGSSYLLLAHPTGAGLTYQWSDSSGVITGATNASYSATTGGSYSVTVTNSCGSASSSKIVTEDVPYAGSIPATSTVCVGDSITLIDTVAGGTWHSSDNAYATVDNGEVKGVYQGLVIISFSVTDTLGCTTHLYDSVTVQPLPDAGFIYGTSPICDGGTSTFITGSAYLGIWSSSDTSIATVDSYGHATAHSAGIDTIYFSVSNSCGTSTVKQALTVQAFPSAGTITGTTVFCAADSITLSDTASGGVWTSSDTSIAKVDNSGIVTGVAAGNDTIKYSVTNSCGTAIATHIITVQVFPTAGTITGVTVFCEADSITLGDTASGGVWTSSDTSIAKVNNSGVVFGIAAGNDTIKYSVTNSCGTDVATHIITVQVFPVAGTITGTNVFCLGTTTILSDTVTAGVWSSSDTSIAKVNNSGIVTGVAAGNDTIKYSVTNSCGTAIATKSISIITLPDAGVISGSTTFCAGTIHTFSDTVSGGVWTSSNTSIATINASSGAVTGVSAGIDTIKYSVTNICGTVVATHIITVQAYPTAGTITGATSFCAGSFTTLSDGISGGVWSSSNTAIATINSSSGVVTGVAAGSATITYSVTNSCGTAVATIEVTVAPASLSPGVIIGDTMVCESATVTFTDSVSGGRWSSSNTTIATVDSLSGSVFVYTVGSDTILYSVSNICGIFTASFPIVVDPFPVLGAISGDSVLCAGTTDSLSVYGDVGTSIWYSYDTTIATVGFTSGVVTGIRAGTVLINHGVYNSCDTLQALFRVYVNPAPDAGIISGASSVCLGMADTLSSSGDTGGVWTSRNTAIATVDSFGDVRGVGVGIDTISYIITNSCGIDTATFSITIITVPGAPDSITGPSSLCIWSSVTYTDDSAGGVWSCTPGALIDSSGNVTGTSLGTVIIYYTDTNICGSTSVTDTISIIPVPDPILGPQGICAGVTDTLTDPTPGGTWSSSDTTIATIGATSGIITGVSGGVVTISYTLGSGCAAFYPITINPLPVITTAPFALVFCGPKIRLTATGADSFSWSPGIYLSDSTDSVVTCTGVPGTTTFTVTGINIDGCTGYGYQTVVLPECDVCSLGSPIYGLAGAIGAIGVDSVIPQGNYYVYGTLNVADTVRFAYGCVVAIAPSLAINVMPKSYFDVMGSILFCCDTSQMWQGIDALNIPFYGSGRVAITGNSFIADAKTGVKISNGMMPTDSGAYVFVSDSVIYNRCNIDIDIDSFGFGDTTVPPPPFIYPFLIRNSVFTSRDMSVFTDSATGNNYPFAWPAPAGTTTALKDTFDVGFWIWLIPPYNINAPNGAGFGQRYNPKVCNDGSLANIGIRLINDGAYQDSFMVNPNVPAWFSEMVIGDSNSNNGTNSNLFDTLFEGIYAKYTNFTCYNNAFSFMRHTTGYPNLTGDGIGGNCPPAALDSPDYAKYRM